MFVGCCIGIFLFENVSFKCWNSKICKLEFIFHILRATSQFCHCGMFYYYLNKDFIKCHWISYRFHHSIWIWTKTLFWVWNVTLWIFDNKAIKVGTMRISKFKIIIGNIPNFSLTFIIRFNFNYKCDWNSIEVSYKKSRKPMKTIVIYKIVLNINNLWIKYKISFLNSIPTPGALRERLTNWEYFRFKKKCNYV